MNYMRELFLQECYGIRLSEKMSLSVDEGQDVSYYEYEAIEQIRQTTLTTMFMVILIRELSRVEDWLHGNS